MFNISKKQFFCHVAVSERLFFDLLINVNEIFVHTAEIKGDILAE